MENTKQPIGLIEDNSKCPAHPVSFAYDSDDGITKVTHFGLNKREHFAAMALQGLMANPTSDIVNAPADLTAKWCIEFADELLKQLSDEPK